MISQERIESLWFTDRSNTELCELLGITPWGLWEAKKRYRLPHRRTALAARRTERKPGDPDEATIAAMCLKIQEGWSQDEERRRRVPRGVR